MESFEGPPYPIEKFYPDLVELELVNELLNDSFGPANTAVIIDKLKKGLFQEVNFDFEDIVTEVIENNYEMVAELTGVGSYGEFSIVVNGYGPLFWIHANDFDPIAYFETCEDAVMYAEIEFGAYLDGSFD